MPETVRQLFHAVTSDMFEVKSLRYEELQRLSRCTLCPYFLHINCTINKECVDNLGQHPQKFETLNKSIGAETLDF